MCSGENNNCSSCISEVLRKILLLQRQDFDCDNFIGCDKPFLGPTPTSICYNTRPIQLYNCCTASPWSFTYTDSEGAEQTSDILRIESLDDCCCTCRLLSGTTGNYTSTGNFVTIDLKCCGAIRCLDDTYVDLC
ncbi:MAG: CotY/CotZ family spore coat protein [Bacilli bacterium]|nr:CotY/CotZ family spore coat protein [Bacilli bacterium]